MTTKSLAEMQEEVKINNVEHGWYAEERTFGDGMALLHSEVSEAFEAFRNWGTADATIRNALYLPKPEGVGSEFADVLIRLFDECERRKIDLEYEYERKMAYNRTREFRHGNKAL